MRLDGYIRVSRVAGRAGDSFISPAVQRERLEAWCVAHGHKLVDVHEELDVSGAAKHRPAFEDALARVEAHDVDGLIVAKLDRFARSQRQALEALERIEQAGGVLVSVEDGFDTSTAIGKAMRSIILVFAELERERTRESWATAQERAVARGVHIASRTPTGYVADDDSRLQPHPEFAAPVADAFRLRADGASWSEIAGHLERHGVVGPYGNKSWTTSSVSKIIRNRVYLGEARSGRHSNPDAHPPLVTRSEWQAAQTVEGRTAPSRGGFLLSGLLRCTGCRYALKGDTMKGRDGSRQSIYRCRKTHPSGVCGGSASAFAHVVEPYVEAAFLDALGPDGPFADAAVASGELEEAITNVTEAELELTTYRDERVAAALGADSFAAGLELRARALDEARRELAAVRDRSTLASTLPATPGLLRDAWPTLSVAERRTLLTAAVDAIFLRPGRGVPIEDRCLILWRGEGPDGLPRRGHRVPLAPFVWPERPDEARLAA